MTIRITFPIWLIFIIISGHSLAQRNIPLLKKRLLDSIALQDVVPKGPGVAVGVVKDGHIIYTKYSGYGDLKDSVLLSKSSRFNIASNAKQFTALAILTLIENKKLRLKDDIRLYIPGLYPGSQYKITIGNLLTHSSGIRDVYDLWSLQGITWWEHTYNNADVVKLISKQKDLNFIPGTRYLYSNTNYILLAEIVKKVSGVSFTAYTNNLFKKLGMANTNFVDNYKTIRGPVARPYFNFDKWTGYNWICNIQGDGNLFTTLDDQLRWEKIIRSKHSKYLSKDLISISQHPIAGSNIQNYGYGLEFGKYKNFDYCFHEGSTGAWKATTLRFPKAGISIVTLTNSGKAISSMQSRQMADVLLDIKTERSSHIAQPEKAGKYISVSDVPGTYQTEGDFTFRFELRDSVLYLLRSGRNDTRLVRESSNVFHQWNDISFKQEFNLNGNNEMLVTAYHTSHEPYTLKRANTNWKGYNFELLNGRFYNNEAGVYLNLTHLKDKIYELKMGTDTLLATLISPLQLLTDNYKIEIKQNATHIDQLLLNGNRIKNVKFVRVKY